MKEIIQRRKNKKAFLGKVFTVSLISFLSVLSVFLLISNWNMYQKMSETKKLGAVTEKSLDQLRDKKEDLKEKINILGTESGIEKEIRDRFPLVKSGEEVIMIVESERNTKDDSFIKDGPSIWVKFIDWINN